MALSIDSFQLEKIVFEARYDRGFLYWDRCGKIWKELTDKWPNLKEINVAPESATFRLGDKALNLLFDKSKCNLTQEFPEDLDTFYDISDKFILVIRENLDINVFKRIGNRYLFLKPFSELSEVIEAIKKIKIISIKEDKIIHLGTKFLELGTNFRIGSDDLNYSIKIGSINRALEVSLPPPLTVDTSRFNKVGLLFDVDIYTEKFTEAGILKPDEFIRANLRRIHKLISSIFS